MRFSIFTFLAFLSGVIVLSLSCGDGDPIRPIDITPDTGVTGPTGEFIDEWTFRVSPQADDNFGTAAFRLWVPQDAGNVRATLVLLSSFNSDALELANSTDWQEFAEREHLALLGVHLTNPSDGTGSYRNASEGSGKALLFALDTLAQKHEISALESSPILLRGYSAGGDFCYNFAGFVPARVVAFANLRGAVAQQELTGSKEVPGLMIVGEDEPDFRVNSIRNVVLNKRIQGAVWGYAIAPGENHSSDLFKSDDLTKEFFSLALSARLPIGADELSFVPETSGWLGNHTTKEVYSFSDYPDQPYDASWLISESFALKWKEFQDD